MTAATTRAVSHGHITLGPRGTHTRTCLALVIAAVGLACRGDLGASAPGAQAVREPAVAGQFYPGDAKRLASALDSVLRDALPASAERPIGLVAPHAGYVFSGQIAADAWRQTDGQSYDTIVILGANHTASGLNRISVYGGIGLRTPLGTARVDAAISAALVKEDPDCVLDISAHATEHSIEVHLPFAQRLFPKAAVVAAIVGTDEPAALTRFGRALARVLGGRTALIVASSDLSHYPAARDAAAADRRTLEAIASLDPDRMRATTVAQVRGVPNLVTCACGEAPIIAAMIASKALGATRGRVVSYANSGDLPVGDRERVVGYGAVAFSAGDRGSDTTALGPRGASTADSALPASDKARLLALARETIRRYLDTGLVPLARGFSPAADRPRGVFVTLRKRGELRGCVGQMAPNAPLPVLAGRMAMAAAFEDARFDKVRAAELKDLDIEISVLTPFREVAGPAAIAVGRDGVVLKKDGRSAVFLPQVATEQRWERDEMLANLCVKAGLAPSCWRSGAKFSTFQAEVFGEKDVK